MEDSNPRYEADQMLPVIAIRNTDRKLHLELPAHWERPLLEKAYTAFDTRLSPGVLPIPGKHELDQAYLFCKKLTYHHSRTFFLASALLPKEKRRAMHALYAFCRSADDLVDNPGLDPRAALAEWRLVAGLDKRKASPSSGVPNPVLTAWTDARRRFNIPPELALQLLDGVAYDLKPARIQTFEELASYAYGVASTVGLMSMHITGFSGRQALPYAIRLGVALQITNILRDVGEDFRSGRIYLPAEELESFGISYDDLAQRRIDERWCRFMRFQIRRNRKLYERALPGIRMLSPDGRLAVTAAADFYAAILDDIEAYNYDVFTRRAHLSAGHKLRRLPGLWWRVYMMEKPGALEKNAAGLARRSLHDPS
jgi:15-cis-phytoene synthase